jgi:Uma2 family endonuclease
MIMSAAALIAVEDYLRLTDKPICEYREGALYRKPMPTKFHGVLEFVLVAMLRKLGLDAVAEVTVRLSPTKYLVPDVIAAPVIQSPYPTEPVLICCEILSPEDRVGTMLAKCEEYHTWGVPYCWVIDPVKRTAWEYHAAEEPARATATLRAGEIAVSLKELFSALPADPEQRQP